MPSPTRSSRVRAAFGLTACFALLLPQAAYSQPDQDDPDRTQLAEELGLDLTEPALDVPMPAAGGAKSSAATTADRSTEVAGAAGGTLSAGQFDDESPTGRWILVLDEPAVASYTGGIDGLAATSPMSTAEEKLDVEDGRTRAYVEHLQGTHEDTVTSMSQELGTEVVVTHDYYYALNGMAVEASAHEASVIADLPGVSMVLPDEINELETDVSNDLIGSPAIWDGATGSGAGTQGEGVIVAMLDSGVNPHHPSFAATDGHGYTHTNPNGSGSYLGLCAPDAPGHQDVCNDKLIGVYNYTSATWQDVDGHGSHVGSTMGGNRHQAQFTVGSTDWDLTVQGVAPRANVISYKICSPGCPSSYAVAAVNQAIVDGVDVLNYSISGPDNPWSNAVDLAFLDAFDAGIYVAASAGNTGPGSATVTKTAPWNATVAASNSPRLIAQDLSVTGPAPVPEELVGMAAVPGSGPAVTAALDAELREASTVAPGNGQGCAAFPADGFEGALALIERGECTFEDKVVRATEAGAVGVIVTNNFAGPPVVMGSLENTTVPAVMVTLQAGTVLRDFALANPGVEVTLDSASLRLVDHSWSPMVADFSGRGPSRFNLLNPTFAAPGRNILAATAASGDEVTRYEFMQGTSMSSPHGAGAGALIKALHPEWSPAMIRSALASTANPEGMLKDDGRTPADAFDVGSGLLDLDAAGRVGLVLDETTEHFLAANPSRGGDPRTLNLPAFVDNGCAGTCTFVRELTGVADVSATYSLDIQSSEAMSVSVEPSTFTLDPGQTQEITVVVDVASASPADGWQFGDLRVSTEGTHPNGSAIATVHYPITMLPVNPIMTVSPTSVTSTQGVDLETKHPLTIRNDGTGPLDWSLTDEPEGCQTPDWASIQPSSGQTAPRRNETVNVILDSAGMAGGTYDGVLCIGGNDPTNPVARIDLSLTVEEIPAIVVDSPEVEITQPADSTTTSTTSIHNEGYGSLEWTFTDPDVGPSAERVDMLRQGVLLTPVTGAPRNVVALDTEDGSLVDDAFIPTMPSGTSLMVLPLPDNTGVLVTDQPGSVINKYDLDGNYVGVFAPRHGMDPDIMRNIRGMTWSPQGTLVVAAYGLTTAGDPNINTLLEFDQYGNYLGILVDRGLDGLNQPWSPIFREDDLLVSASSSRAVHSFSHDGNEVNPRFTTQMHYPMQIVETNEKTVLGASWSTGRDFLPAGVHEFDAQGRLQWSGTIPGATNYGGVHELGNGNLLVSTGEGTFSLDRDGSYEHTFSGQRTRMIAEAHMPTVRECQTPDEVPWLTVDPASGSTGSGTSTEVTITTDSTGLVDGEYSAQLCVSSDDPVRPYVPVLVTMNVTHPSCDISYDGVVRGGLVVEGVVCLEPGSRVNGGVTVQPGSTLLADGSTIKGRFTATGADWIEVTNSTLSGQVSITGTSRKLVLDGNAASSSVVIDRNSTDETPIVVAENSIGRDLRCSGNTPPPTHDGRPNSVAGTRTGQCSDL